MSLAGPCTSSIAVTILDVAHFLSRLSIQAYYNFLFLTIQCSMGSAAYYSRVIVTTSLRPCATVPPSSLVGLSLVLHLVSACRLFP
jgi:hypothetical protein